MTEGATQTTLQATMYVYECPHGCRTYWHSDPPRKYYSLPCETCDADCKCVDSFSVSLFGNLVEQLEGHYAS